MKKKIRNILIICISLVACVAIIGGSVVLAINISSLIDKKNNDFDIDKEGVLNVSYKDYYSKDIRNVCISKNEKMKNIETFEFDEFQKNKISYTKCFKSHTKDGKKINEVIDKDVYDSNNRRVDYYEERYDRIFYFVQDYSYYLGSDISVWEKEDLIFFFFVPNVNWVTCTDLFYYKIDGEVTRIAEIQTDDIKGIQILKNL